MACKRSGVRSPQAPPSAIFEFRRTSCLVWQEFCLKSGKVQAICAGKRCIRERYAKWCSDDYWSGGTHHGAFVPCVHTSEAGASKPRRGLPTVRGGERNGAEHRRQQLRLTASTDISALVRRGRYRFPRGTRRQGRRFLLGVSPPV